MPSEGRGESAGTRKFHSVPGTPHKITPKQRHDDAAGSWRPAKVEWPAPAVGDAVLVNDVRRIGTAGTARRPAAGPKPVRAGTLPVWVTAVPPGRERAVGVDSGTQAAPPARVRVEVKDQASAARLGVRGVVFTATPAAGAAWVGAVSLALDYSGFRDAFGGDWSTRLQLAEFPACALTTPDEPACRTQTALRTRNDPRERRLSAQVALAGPGRTGAASGVGGSNRTVVLAAVAAPAGSAGTYAATSLAPSGSWSVGGSTGNFTWSYPITPPPAPGALEPELSLDYDSGTVDGRVAADEQPDV